MNYDELARQPLPGEEEMESAMMVWKLQPGGIWQALTSRPIVSPPLPPLDWETTADAIRRVTLDTWRRW